MLCAERIHQMRLWLEKISDRPERAILLLSLVLLLAGNWILPLTDRDETRFAEASREMLQRHDFVVPWFNGAWRFDKPILIYWCQAVSYLVLGENPFAARLPSVLFTTGTALIITRWGRKIYDAKTGFLAGAMFVTGLHVAMIGRVATADMAMVFFSTLAVWSGWELTRPGVKSFSGWWWLFYVTLALGFLAKGPVAWLPIGGLILGRLLRKYDFRLPLIETIGGLCLASALSAAWGIPAIQQTHGQYLKVGMGEHVVFRSVGVIDGHGLAGLLGFIATFPLYFITFFVSFFPWSTNKPERFDEWWPQVKAGEPSQSAKALGMIVWMSLMSIPIRIGRWWPQRSRDPFGWYLLLQALIVFLVFSCVRTKLPHYTMPAFPCIALWLAVQIARERDVFTWLTPRLTGMAVAVFIITLGFCSFARPHLLTENLWEKLQPSIRPETKVGCFGYTEPSLVWKFRSATTNYVTLAGVSQAADFLTNSPPFILVLPTANLTTLASTNGTLIQARGIDMVKVKNWNLTAIVRP